MEAFIGVLCLFAFSDHLVTKGQALLDDGIFISSGPSSLNVSVNQEAAFICQADSFHGNLSLAFVKWFLNASPLEEAAVPENMSFVKVNATTQEHTVRLKVDDTNAEKLNNSNITCRGYYDNVLEQYFELTSFSEPALLRVQGILSSPEIFNTSIENGFVSLQWQEPFILSGVDIDYYQFNVTVKASLGPNDVTTNNATNRTEDMQWSFLEPYDGICNVYNICVQAVSAAGLGDPARIINLNETETPEKVSVEDIDVNVAFMPDANVISTYTFDQDYCFQRRAENFTLMAALSNRPSLIFHNTTTPGLHQPVILVMKVSQSLSSEVGNVTIVLTNSAGSTESDPINTAMSCIQDVSFLDDQSVQCLFVEGCVAIGCKIVIKCDQLSSVEQEPHTLNLMRKSDSLVSEGGPLPCDSIANCTANSFLVYAIYNNSTSHSEVPDVVQSEIPLDVCSTSTKTVSMYTSSSAVMMDSQSTSPTQSSIPKGTEDISISMLLVLVLNPLSGLLSIIWCLLLIWCIIELRRLCTYKGRKINLVKSPSKEFLLNE